MSIDSTVSDRVQPPSDAGPDVTLRIELFGRFRVSVDGRMVQPSGWRLRKAAQLVQLLALTPGHQLRREQVMDILWPDFSPESAGNNLRVTLHAARHALEPGQTLNYRFLQYAGRSLYLSPGESIWVDVHEFEEAAELAYESQRIDAFESALALYHDDLLVDDLVGTWAMERHEALRDTYLTLLLDLADFHAQHLAWSPAIAVLKKVLARDATNEDAHAGLMYLYARMGRPLRALKQYERLRTGLRRELDVEPAPQTQRFHEAIASGNVGAALLESMTTTLGGTGSSTL